METWKGNKLTVIYRDLDHLFGRWSEKEFNQINRFIDSERKIDQELWYGVRGSNMPPLRTSLEFIKFLI